MDLPSDIALCRLRFAADEAARMEALLSPAERMQMLSYKHAGRRQEFVLGRAAARQLLAERLGTDAARVPLRVAGDGAVEVVGAEYYVSIAHSGEDAVAAVGTRRLGVDLERIAPRHPELHRFLLHPDEYGIFEKLPLDRTRACILYWTLKEAALKALRTGFRLSPKKLRLDLDLENRAARTHVEGGPVLHSRFEEDGQFFTAVAFEGELAGA